MSFLEYVARRCTEQLGATFSAFRNVRGYLTRDCSEAYPLSTSGTVGEKTGWATGSATFNNSRYATGLPDENEFWPYLGRNAGSIPAGRSGEVRKHAGDMSFSGYDLNVGSSRPTAAGGFGLPNRWESGSATVQMLVDWEYARKWLESLLAESTTVQIVDLWVQDKVHGRFSVQNASIQKTGKTPTQMPLTINLVGHGQFDEVA